MASDRYNAYWLSCFFLSITRVDSELPISEPQAVGPKDQCIHSQELPQNAVEYDQLDEVSDPIKPINLLIFKSEDFSEPYTCELVRPGIEVAIRKARALYNVSFLVSEYSCGVCNSDAYGSCMGYFVQFVKQNFADHGRTVVLTSSCKSDVVAIGNLISHFKMGVALSPNVPFRKAFDFPRNSIVRVSFSASSFWSPLLFMCQEFGWTNINVIYYQTDHSVTNQERFWYDLAFGKSKTRFRL